ncbi:hypothetical protein EIP86_003274 [Pleurotus ostreatoroseus]|nr:hypothetical protein EIP86_003274 [Pleurotus ostreatoroseus]
MLLNMFLALVLVGVLYALWTLAVILVRIYTSPLRRLPGPPRDSLFFGNFKAILKADNSVLQEKWVAEYGDVIAYPGVFGVWRLVTLDTKALNHILTHSSIYQKPEQSRYHLARTVGPGVLVAEAEQHRLQLRDIWASQATIADEVARIDVLTWLSKTTLDIIGLAGFNYAFNALNPDGEVNELNAAFNTIFSSAQEQHFWNMLQGFLHPLRVIRTQHAQRAAHSQEVMRRIGLQLIADKKAAIQAEKHSDKERLERKDMTDRDLLTLLIKANMATDIPENQKLSDEEVLAPPDVQRKLRQELLSISTDMPTMDELMALPYLDMVVKETLRVHTPVPMTGRIATQDDRIPLNTPFTDRYGKVHDSIV